MGIVFLQVSLLKLNSGHQPRGDGRRHAAAAEQPAAGRHLVTRGRGPRRGRGRAVGPGAAGRRRRDLPRCAPGQRRPRGRGDPGPGRPARGAGGRPVARPFGGLGRAGPVRDGVGHPGSAAAGAPSGATGSTSGTGAPSGTATPATAAGTASTGTATTAGTTGASAPPGRRAGHARHERHERHDQHAARPHAAAPSTPSRARRPRRHRLGRPAGRAPWPRAGLGRAVIERRIGLLFAVFLALLVLAGARAAWLGTCKGDSLASAAATQQVARRSRPRAPRHDHRPQRRRARRLRARRRRLRHALPRQGPRPRAARLAPLLGKPRRRRSRSSGPARHRVRLPAPGAPRARTPTGSAS